MSERASGTTSYYHGDQLGSTRGLTNSSQTVTASRERDAWGNVVFSSGTLAGPFGFVGGQGYQQDPDSGLMLLGARYYDPSVGRFLSRDPIRFRGGDPCLYRYCQNRPTTSCDPAGEANYSIGIQDPGLVQKIVDGRYQGMTFKDYLEDTYSGDVFFAAGDHGGIKNPQGLFRFKMDSLPEWAIEHDNNYEDHWVLDDNGCSEIGRNAYDVQFLDARPGPTFGNSFNVPNEPQPWETFVDEGVMDWGEGGLAAFPYIGWGVTILHAFLNRDGFSDGDDRNVPLSQRA